MKTLRLISLSLILSVTIGCVSKTNQQQALNKVSLDGTRSIASSALIWVAKPDQSKLCEKSGISLYDAAKELEKAGVKFYYQKKIIDSKPKIQVCGADKQDQNSFQINKQDLPKAETLLFKLRSLEKKE